jgi:ABC-type glycerol-3-phosphate transport system substrate-binding protein
MKKSHQLLLLSLAGILLIGTIIFMALHPSDGKGLLTDAGSPSGAFDAPTFGTQMLDAPTITTTTGSDGKQLTPNQQRITGILADDHYYTESVVFEDINGFYMSKNSFFSSDEDNNLIALMNITPSDTRLESYFLRIGEQGYEVVSPMITEINWLEDGTREGRSWYGISRDENGNYYNILYDTNRGMELDIYDKNFNQIRESLVWEGHSSWYDANAAYNGKVYGICSYKLYVNGTNGLKEDLPDEMAMNPTYDVIDIDTLGNIYYVARSNRAGSTVLGKYDLANDTLVFQEPIEMAIRYPVDCIHYSEAYDCVFTLSREGLIKYDANNGEFIEKVLVFGEDTSYLVDYTGSSGGMILIAGLMSDEYGNLYIAITDFTDEDRREHRIYKYAVTSGKPNKGFPREQLVLTSEYAAEFIRESVRRFNLVNKETEIVLDVMFETVGEASLSADQAMQRISVRLMTDDVGDIVSTGVGGYDYYALFQTDAFIDLSNYIKSDKNHANLNQSMLKKMEIDGEIRGLPVTFLSTYFELNTTLNEQLGIVFPDLFKIKWSDFMHAAERLQGRNDSHVIYNGESSVLNMMLFANIPDLIDLQHKSCDLKQDWFINLLTDYKNIALMDNYITYEPDKPALFQIYEPRYVNNASEHPWQAMQIPKFSGEINRNSFAYPVYMYSITANSTKQDKAWEFLSFLLEDHGMGSFNYGAMPLNNNILERWLKNTEFSDENKSFYRFMAQDIDYVYHSNFYSVIGRWLAEYIWGSLTLTEALDGAEYDIWLKMNE